MNYKDIIQLDKTLNEESSIFFSISNQEYNYLLRIVDEEQLIFDKSKKIELSTNDLKALIKRAIKSLNS